MKATFLPILLAASSFLTPATSSACPSADLRVKVLDLPQCVGPADAPQVSNGEDGEVYANAGYLGFVNTCEYGFRMDERDCPNCGSGLPLELGPGERGGFVLDERWVSDVPLGDMPSQATFDWELAGQTGIATLEMTPENAVECTEGVEPGNNSGDDDRGCMIGPTPSPTAVLVLLLRGGRLARRRC